MQFSVLKEMDRNNAFGLLLKTMYSTQAGNILLPQGVKFNWYLLFVYLVTFIKFINAQLRIENRLFIPILSIYLTKRYINETLRLIMYYDLEVIAKVQN